MKRKKEHRQPQAGMKNPSKATKTVNPETWKYYVALAIILLISFLIYLPVFHNGFFILG